MHREKIPIQNLPFSNKKDKLEKQIFSPIHRRGTLHPFLVRPPSPMSGRHVPHLWLAMPSRALPPWPLLTAPLWIGHPDRSPSRRRGLAAPAALP